MKRPLYVSGPMTGIEAFNVPAFNAAAAMFRAEGWEVVNPAELDAADDVPIGAREWTDYLRRDIKALTDCGTIAMLPGWEGSRGAKLEHTIALELEFEVIYLKPPSPVAIAEQARAEVE